MIYNHRVLVLKSIHRSALHQQYILTMYKILHVPIAVPCPIVWSDFFPTSACSNWREEMPCILSRCGSVVEVSLFSTFPFFSSHVHLIKSLPCQTPSLSCPFACFIIYRIKSGRGGPRCFILFKVIFPFQFSFFILFEFFTFCLVITRIQNIESEESSYREGPVAERYDVA